MRATLVKDQPAAADTAQALIEEAQHRKRRRWLLRSAVAIVSALVIGVVLTIAVISRGAGAGKPSAERQPSASLGTAGRGTVKGRLVGIGTPLRAGPTFAIKVPGTVQFVAERGGKTFTTKVVDGRWRITVPAGTYKVEGQGNYYRYGKKYWHMASSVMEVRAGQTQSIALVIYGTTK